MFELKNVKMTTGEGKRNVRFANAIRKQMVGKIVEAIENAGFDVSLAATGILEVLAIRIVFSISGLLFLGSISFGKSSKTSVISFPLSPQPI